MRPNRHEYFMGIALAVRERAECRGQKVGAVIACRSCTLGRLPYFVYPIYTLSHKSRPTTTKLTGTKIRAARCFGGPFYD